LNVHGWIRRITEPSLARRLVLSQSALLAVLWLSMIGYFVYDIAFVDEWFEPKQMQERSDMILAVADALSDRPEQLATSLLRIDEFQRDENRERDDPGVRVTMNVWLGEQLVYRSPGEPGVVTTTELDTIEKSVQNGRRLRTYTRESANSDARVTLILPGDAGVVFLTLWSNGIVLLPLLVCTPLLLIPAWLSVRYALRPFRTLSAELEDKGPADLAPLAFRPRHRELRPLVTAVDGLLERLRSGIARERRFIADAAHELRTPLAAMTINVETLQNRSSVAADKPVLQSLLNSGERATRMVRQLLSLMRSDAVSTAIQSAPTDLSEFVGERLALLAPLARAKHVDIELDTAGADTVIDAGRESLASLVDNLTENAIKYSPAGEVISVRIESHPDCVELSIADAGPGIPATLRERVFERFYRAPDQSHDGSGLGLAIVRTVADAIGASVHLDESSRGGLLARVRFRKHDDI